MTVTCRICEREVESEAAHSTEECVANQKRVRSISAEVARDPRIIGSALALQEALSDLHFETEAIEIHGASFSDVEANISKVIDRVDQVRRCLKHYYETRRRLLR